MQKLIFALLLATASGFFTPPPTFAVTSSKTSLQASNRRDFLVSSASIVATFAPFAVSAADSGTVEIKKVKNGNGPTPDVGELAAIRFKATVGETTIDDIFETSEPLYTRVGSGGLLKGVEQTLPQMRVGDRWVLTIPGSLAFGSKGRPASAGKPRIPADSTVVFDVEMVGLPGKEPELIELIGDV